MHQPGDNADAILLRRAFAHWESELRAIGGPNDLLELDLTSPRLLDLGVAHPSGLAGFLAGRTTRLSALFRSPDSLRTAQNRARWLSLAARRLTEVYGLPGAFLATGVLRFDDPLLGPVRAPIVLRPLTLVPRGSGRDLDFDLDPADDARLNPALVALLSEQGFDIVDQPVDNQDHGVAARQLIDRLSGAVATLDATIIDRTVAGTFSEVGPSMVTTLRVLEGEVSRHRTIHALLRRPTPDPTRPGTQPAAGPSTGGGLSWQVADRTEAENRSRAPSVPGPTRAVLLDDAQRAVLDDVLAGGDVRVEAAPGSGTTTTAATIIEALADARRRVLVVAPARDELADLVAVLRTDPTSTAAAVVRDSAAHDRLHDVDPDWQLSRMQILDRLAGLGATPTDPGAARLSPATLQRLAADRSEAVALLSAAGRAEAYTSTAVSSPWAGAAIAEARAAEDALARVRRLVDTELPLARSLMAEVATEVGLPVGLSFTEWTAHVEVLTSVRGTLDLMRPEVYEQVTEEMVVAVASSNWRTEHGAAMSLLDRRRWKREALGLVRPGVHAADLHASLSRARLEQDLWSRLGGSGRPSTTPRLMDAIKAYDTVAEAVRALEPVLSGSAVGGDLADLGLDELTERLRRLEAAGADLRTLPERARTLDELDALGLTPLVGQLQAAPDREPDVARMLEIAWLQGVLAAVGGLPPARTAGPEPALRPLAELPDLVGRALTMTTGLAVGTLPAEARFDTVVLLDAHRIGLSEAVLAIGRGDQTVLIGDPAGGAPTGLDLDAEAGAGDPTDRPRTSVFTASAGRLTAGRLDRVHRQPRRLAELTHRLAVGPAVRPSWSVASADGGELSLVHVPGGTVSADETEEPIPVQEVEGVVAAIAEHVRSRPQESLAVLTVGRGMAVEVTDVLRRALRRSPELSDWLTQPTTEPLVVTDLQHAEELTRDHVIIALGLAHDSFGRFSHRFGILDSDHGARLLAVAVGRARHRVTLVSSLWPDDIDPAADLTEGGRRALTLLALANDQPDPFPPAEAPAVSSQPPETLVEPGTHPLLDTLVAELGPSQVRRGSDHDREPDLALTVQGRAVAVVWDGWPQTGTRRPLTTALERFGWQVRHVSAVRVAGSAAALAGALRQG